MSFSLKSMNIAKASEELLRIMMFEQWIRFYFLEDRDGTLYVNISQEALDRIGERQADLLPLAELMNGEEITYEKCQATVCSFAGSRLDGQRFAPEVLPKAFDSKDFKVEMYMFQLWNRLHEKFLDERFHDFEEWEEMIAEWNKLDEIREYREKLILGGQQGAGSEPQVQ
ncbi:hypothetical protein SAMN02745704_01692 [Paucidesulfovibrio gracilis DSM 16080]|uniref:Uncharacterized protein n=1 Tax=Paucidesulfovibrio gracilis DSM 16080 TaxID=1121449 RepID=A0A1T4X472_9BACT|nr:hypothetical protein [Paucidesulfovibrio gracilis]SKA83651.1 hypothetical protein SAMN02745704_01692 [Paucidesulfovibrio gracilis DSM 16080]